MATNEKLVAFRLHLFNAIKEGAALPNKHFDIPSFLNGAYVTALALGHKEEANTILTWGKETR